MNYPYTQEDKTPELDSMAADYYELEAHVKELAKELNRIINQPIVNSKKSRAAVKKWQVAKNELDRMKAKYNIK
jgi:hypothetical protein